MFSSTIIPTVNRSTLSKAVYSVLNQDFDQADFEVIVVNDSGQPLPQADWQKSDQVKIVNTNRRRLSVARNVGAAVAKGKYLHFLDDDDWLLPDALKRFWSLAQHVPDAILLYGGAEFVDSKERCLGVVNLRLSGNCASQIIGGSWIPAQAWLIKTQSFFELGGFNPLFGPAEEVELCGRAVLYGDFANIPESVVRILRGSGWQTTVNYDKAIAYNRWSRNIALSEPGVYSRLYASADSGYWHGRIVRVYLTDVLWNLRHKRLLTGISRAFYGIVGVMTAGFSVGSVDFWEAIKDSQAPVSHARVLEDPA